MQKTELIERVQDGMRVVDVEGNDIGKVEFVKMGDPEAATTRGNEIGPSSGVVPLDSDYDEPEVPEPIRSDLLRMGFIKVDGKGLFDTDRYFRADTIQSIEGDCVCLRLPESRGAVEGEEGTVHKVPFHRERDSGGPVVMPPGAAGQNFPGSTGTGPNH